MVRKGSASRIVQRMRARVGAGLQPFARKFPNAGTYVLLTAMGITPLYFGGKTFWNSNNERITRPFGIEEMRNHGTLTVPRGRTYYPEKVEASLRLVNENSSPERIYYYSNEIKKIQRIDIQKYHDLLLYLPEDSVRSIEKIVEERIAFLQKKANTRPAALELIKERIGRPDVASYLLTLPPHEVATFFNPEELVEVKRILSDMPSQNARNIREMVNRRFFGRVSKGFQVTIGAFAAECLLLAMLGEQYYRLKERRKKKIEKKGEK